VAASRRQSMRSCRPTSTGEKWLHNYAEIYI
jgi:hypothetical protein